MTKQELICRMMDGNRWEHRNWKDGSEVVFDGNQFIEPESKNNINIFYFLTIYPLDGWRHTMRAEVPAWRWVYVDNAEVQVVVHVTGQALPDREAAQQYVGAGCTVLHRCDETETLTDME